jgi:hypothetical protein
LNIYHAKQKLVENIQKYAPFDLFITFSTLPFTTIEDANKAFSKILNATDKRFIGSNGVEKYNRRLQRVCSIENNSFKAKTKNTLIGNNQIILPENVGITYLPEGKSRDKGKNIHLHCILKTSYPLNKEEIAGFVALNWQKLCPDVAGRLHMKEINNHESEIFLHQYITKWLHLESICLKTSTLC